MAKSRKPAKPKLGRPPLPPSKARRTLLVVRLTPDERDAYAAAARRAGLPLGVWVRARCDAGI